MIEQDDTKTRIKAAKQKIQEGFQEYLAAKSFDHLDPDNEDQWEEDEDRPEKTIPLMLTDIVVIGHQIGFTSDDDMYSLYPFIFGVGNTMATHSVKGMLQHMLDQLI